MKFRKYYRDVIDDWNKQDRNSKIFLSFMFFAILCLFIIAVVVAYQNILFEIQSTGYLDGLAADIDRIVVHGSNTTA